MHRVARYHDEQLSIVELGDRVDRTNALCALEMLFDPNEKPCLRKCLVETSGIISIDLIFQDILFLRNMTEHFLLKHAIDCKIAVVAEQDVPFGLARIYEQLLNVNGVAQGYVTRNYAQALDWLGVADCDPFLLERNTR